MAKLKKRSLGKTSKDALVYIGSKGATKVISFALLPVWTMLFSPEEYGTIGLLAAYGGVLSTLILCGLPSSIVREYSEFRGRDAEWRNYLGTITLFFSIIAAIVMTIGIYGESLWLQFGSSGIAYFPLIPLCLLGIVVGGYIRFYLAVSNAARRPWLTISIEQGIIVGSLLIALVLVGCFHYGVIGYLSAPVISSFIILAVLTFRIKSQLFAWRPRWKHLKSAIHYGLPLVPQAMAVWILSISDRVIIEIYHGLSETGYYNLAANVSMSLSLVVVSLNQAINPRYFQLRLKREKTSNSEVRKLSYATIGILTVLGISMILLAPPLLGFVVNERYSPALSFLAPLTLGFYFYGVYQMFMRPMLLNKKTGLLAILTVLGAVLNIVLNLIFIPEYGALAATWTTVASYFVVGALAWIVSRRYDKLELPFMLVSVMIIVTALSCLVSINLSINELPSLGIRVIATIIGSSLVLWQLRSIFHAMCTGKKIKGASSN